MFVGMALISAGELTAHLADNRLTHRLRLAAAQRLSQVSLGWFTDRASGEVKQAMQDDIGTLHSLTAHFYTAVGRAAGGIAIAVIYLFVQDWRLALVAMLPFPGFFLFLRRVTATIIPAVAVPISLIATLAAMYLFGFSIDNISLMGLTLAVGLVVDDAIVMLENIFRHMEEDGLPAFEAALKGSREIGFTIISISISLVAVFIPVLLMGGVIGLIFNEFAVVVTVSILASMFVSLTLTPMLCSRLLRVSPAEREAHGDHHQSAFTRGYGHVLGFCLRHQFLVFLIFVGTAALSVWLIEVSPKGFFPQEDIGQLSVTTQARQDISFDAMVKLQGQVAQVFEHSPFVTHVAWSVVTDRPPAI